MGCQKDHIIKIYLHSHLNIHTGIKSFQCEMCDKFFKTNQELKIHLVTHTGIKKYNCEICHKLFGHNSSLRKHLKIHIREKNQI